MKTYRDLVVWQKSIILVSEIYRISKMFPKYEIYCLSNQIRRAAISIPSNIAEGYGRFYTKDYIRFLQIARGSLYELQTQLEIARNQEYMKSEVFHVVFEKSREVERMLSSLIAKIS